MYFIEKFSNGLTLVTAEMPEMASVSIGIWCAAGGRNEPESLSGISHFLEHLLFKGTQNRTSRQISEEVEGIGGYLNAFTAEENTCYHAKASAVHHRRLLDVLLDMYLHPRLRSEDVNRERSVIKDEIAMYLDQPQQYVLELLNETLWPDQPLGRTLTGTEQSLDRIRRPHLLRHHRGYYTTGSTVIAAAGRIRHSQWIRALRRFVRHFPSARMVPWPVVQIGQSRPRVRLCTRETEQTQLALGIRTCSRHDPRRHPIRVLNAILGENMSSRLFQLLREKHGLAYNIYSSAGFFADDGSITISAGVDTPRAPETLRLIIGELRRLRRQSPSPNEVRQARDYLIGQLDLSLENTENHMMWIAEQYLGYGNISALDTVRRRLRRVTPAMVRRAAEEFFQPDRLNLAVVSPLKSTRHLAAELRL